jgi:preprotein translocase subunit Sec61beta
MAGNQPEFLVVLLAWILAGIATAFFFLNRNAALKRRLWPRYVVGAAILFSILVCKGRTPEAGARRCIPNDWAWAALRHEAGVEYARRRL